MWIFCCGAQRSGSTLQYNIVAEIVEQTHSGRRITYFEAKDFPIIKEKYAKYDGLKVVKTHKISQPMAEEFSFNNAMGVYCYRDIKDVIVSIKNKNKNSETIESIIDSDFIETYIEDYFTCQHLNKLLQSRYEDFVLDIKSEIRRVSQYLNINITDEVVDEIENRLKIENLKNDSSQDLVEYTFSNGLSQKYDRKTLLHKNHIHSGEAQQWKKTLKNDEILDIERKAFEWLYNHNYEVHLETKDQRLYSYSQCGEDDLIWRFFDKKNRGLIIEVGAFDGVHLSNSYALNNIGWKSICIEANPSSFEFLRLNRLNSSNYLNAIVGSEYEADYVDFMVESSGLYSGISVKREDVDYRYIKRNLEFEGFTKIKVPATTLDNILERQRVKPNTIDCITIDVEGYEKEVLSGIDLNFYQPKMLIIEANHEADKIELQNYLNKYGFELGRILGPNLVFVKPTFLKKIQNIKIDYVQMPQRHPNGKVYVVESLSPTREENNQPKQANGSRLKKLWKKLRSQ